MGKLQNKQTASQDAHWVPLADLMTGLMMVFLFISVVFMLKIEQENKKMKNIIIVYDKTKAELYKNLNAEFADDLKKWGAEIDKDLTIRFKAPEVLFDTGAGDIKPSFKQILNNFFPRYIQIIGSKEYKNLIEEIRIEGHTSSFWSQGMAADASYILNMELSQKRTRSVLQYVLSLPNLKVNHTWLKSNLTANGLSSSKLIYKSDGKTEDSQSSQRVEFRIKTNAESKINTILEQDSNPIPKPIMNDKEVIK